MSDELQDAVDKMATGAELEPIVDGVSKIAKHVTDRTKEQDQRIEANSKKIDRSIEDLEGKVNVSMKELVDRFDDVKKTVTRGFEKAIRFAGGGNDLLEVIPKSIKERMGDFEHAASTVPEAGGRLREPEVYAAATRWFEITAKAGLSRFSQHHSAFAEEASKISAAFDSVSKAAMQEGTDGEGGYLVPTLVASEINRLILDAGDLWPRMRQVALQSWKTNFPTQNTACTVNWIAEEGALTQGEPTFSQVTIQADKLAGRAKFSIELMQDSAPTLLSYLLTVFTEKMAGELDYQAVLGDGTSPELLGITLDANLVQDTLSTRANLTWKRVVAGYMGASEMSARRDGVWLASPKGYAELLKLTDQSTIGVGNPLLQWGLATREAPFGTLLGRPIIVSARWGGSETLDNTTAATLKTKLLFGPPSALIAGTRQGMSWDVTDAVGWANYQMDARLVGRFGSRPVVGAAWVSVENIIIDT